MKRQPALPLSLSLSLQVYQPIIVKANKMEKWNMFMPPLPPLNTGVNKDSITLHKASITHLSEFKIIITRIKTMTIYCNVLTILGIRHSQVPVESWREVFLI